MPHLLPAGELSGPDQQQRKRTPQIVGTRLKKTDGKGGIAVSFAPETIGTGLFFKPSAVYEMLIPERYPFSVGHRIVGLVTDTEIIGEHRVLPINKPFKVGCQGVLPLHGSLNGPSRC